MSHYKNTLSEADQLCLTCSLPECDESNPNCPRRIALQGASLPAITELVLQALARLRQATSVEIAEEAGVTPIAAMGALHYLWKEQRVDRLPHRDTISRTRYLYMTKGE